MIELDTYHMVSFISGGSNTSNCRHFDNIFRYVWEISAEIYFVTVVTVTERHLE